MKVKSLFPVAVLAFTSLTFAPASQAAVVYSQGFESGTFGPGWTVGSPYYSNCSGQQNCIVSGGAQAGNYYYQGGTVNGSDPGDHRFFISDSFTVTANTNYTLTFFLRDDYPQASGQPYNVPILAKINGAALGGTVSAANYDWNQIDLNWNSGAATSASISLLNEYQLSVYNGAAPGNDWGYGNDFAVDSISLSSVASTTNNNVPEPGSLLLLSLGLAGLGFVRRNKV